MEKTFWATNVITFLGFLINTITQTVSIPNDKVERAITLVSYILGKKKVTVHDLEKLCGFLNFICRCIVPGHAFTRRIYSYFSSAMKPYHHIKVTKEIRADLEMWMQFLSDPTMYCRPFIDYESETIATELNWMTDASGKIGFGGMFGSHWMQEKWEKEFLDKKPSIEYLELFGLTASVLAWGHLLIL